MAGPEHEGDSPILGEPHGGVGKKSVHLSLLPKDIDSETEQLKPDAEERLVRQLSGDGVTDERGKKDVEWFDKLQHDIESGEKKAWYYPTVGKVVFVIAASAVATELVRKGKDVRSLSAQIQKLRKKG